MVPDRLQTVLRDREWNPVDSTVDPVTTFCQLGCCGNRFGRVVDALWRSDTAVRRVNVHLVRWISFEHRLLADGQFVGVLIHVCRGNGKQYFVTGIWVRMMHALFVSSRRCGDATVPGRDGAVGIAGFLATQWGEVLAETRCIISRNCCKPLADQQQASHENNHCLKR